MRSRRVCPQGHVYIKTRRALTSAGLTTLEKLARCRERDVQALHGMGPNGLRRLRAALAKAGLGFAPDKKIAS